MACGYHFFVADCICICVTVQVVGHCSILPCVCNNSIAGGYEKFVEGRKYIGFILLSMIPAVIVGVGFEEQMTSLFNQKILLVALFLFLNGVMLISSDYFPKGNKPISGGKAFIIGIFQAIAILPGISRSGSTITSSVAMGIDRQTAARFSFIAVIPLIVGKMAKDLMDGTLASAQEQAFPLILGFVVSLLVGIVACRWMFEIVKKAKLRYLGF